MRTIEYGAVVGQPFYLPDAENKRTGAFVWHIFVRPVEEADLQARFGDEYSRYRQVVGLWVPRSRSRSLRLKSSDA